VDHVDVSNLSLLNTNLEVAGVFSTAAQHMWLDIGLVAFVANYAKYFIFQKFNFEYQIET
jgi:hypothetical protein